MKKVDKEISSMFKGQIERAIESWLRYDLPFGKDIFSVELLDGKLSITGNNLTGRRLKMLNTSIKKMHAMNVNVSSLVDTVVPPTSK